MLFCSGGALRYAVSCRYNVGVVHAALLPGVPIEAQDLGVCALVRDVLQTPDGRSVIAATLCGSGLSSNHWHMAICQRSLSTTSSWSCTEGTCLPLEDVWSCTFLALYCIGG